MTPLRALLVPAIAFGLFAGPATATDDAAYAEAARDVVETVVIPGYATLASAAERQKQSMEVLCETPALDSLSDARADFGALVLAWSRVESIRFGPVSQDYRSERLFYWPDRRGRGLRQVQAILAKQDETAATSETLREKSVAVQGLPALEFVLFGTGSDMLSSGASFRCTYGLAIAGVVHTMAEDIVQAWKSAAPPPILSPGPDNARYKSGAEALQEIVQAARDGFQLVKDLKIAAVIGDEPGDAKPKRAPFWRSGLTIAAIDANLDGAHALLGPPVADLLDDESTNLVRQIDFELTQIDRVLSRVQSDGRGWVAIAESDDGHKDLAYLRFPLSNVVRLAGNNYPAALGLTLGFNSLDGD